MSEQPHYSEGICGDGAAILKDGQPMPIEQIVAELNAQARIGSPEQKLADAARKQLGEYLELFEPAPTPPEPSAEAVEAVARALYDNAPTFSYRLPPWEKASPQMRQPWLDKAQAALAADPLRRELGELVERWSYRDDPVPRQELAALLEKHA